MDSIYDNMSPEIAEELQQTAKVIYETREHRRVVLARAGAADEATLLARIADGTLGEHPAYERYLAARILDDTCEAARAALAARLKEVNR
ncbi:hypothetical protein J5J83_18810 [Azoarcus sp. L1K30]|uniref:hypothetical protein n=1 Tax=Azoarcus sp. L1K30 TaxID=2820277 RepID=UPI001B82ACF6|nr:hypothetical protein [Azoarcus sp. L1K30]MBR0568176.1 hypothetical protein [Azoarcus sp. L1K30]